MELLEFEAYVSCPKIAEESIERLGWDTIFTSYFVCILLLLSANTINQDCKQLTHLQLSPDVLILAWNSCEEEGTGEEDRRRIGESKKSVCRCKSQYYGLHSF